VERKISARELISERILELRKDFFKTQSDRSRNSLKEMELLNLKLFSRMFGVEFDGKENEQRN
jgi:hypothetical protein